MNTLFTDVFDDMFEQLNAMFNSRAGDHSLNTYGLKHVIKRPHNLYTIKDDNGNIISYKLDVVTTPFKKEDVKIAVEDGVLTVTCGNENYKDADEDYMIYRGISAQSYQFSLKLNKIDAKAITAKIEDGILHIEMPVVAEKKPEPLMIEIK